MITTTMTPEMSALKALPDGQTLGRICLSVKPLAF